MDTEKVSENSAESKNKRPCYMWVMLAVFCVAILGIIAVIVVVDMNKDDDDDAVGTDMSDGSSHNINKPQPSNYTVLVLGAGVSGLRAAQVLSEAGANIQILEGSDRIGGRIKEGKLGGVNLEVGATWIYSSNTENPIYRYAQKVNLTTTLTDYESYVYRNETGHDITDKADELYDKWDEVMGKLEELQLLKTKNKEKDMSVKKAMLMFGWEDNTALKAVMEYFDMDFEFAAKADILSVLWSINLATKAKWGDEEYYITDQRGFSIIVDEIAGEFLDKNDSRLHLNTTVTDVEYDSSGVKVTTSTGQVYEADFAVLTFSLGVLQHDVVNFVPELPRWKREAIFTIDMGNYAHIFLKFEESFWDDTEWIVHVHRQTGNFPIFSPYDRHLTEEQLEEFGPTNILMGALCDREAYRVTSLSDDAIKQEMMSVLRSIYGNSIPEPTGILKGPWIHDPLFYGSFSNKPFGFDTEIGADLNAPLGRLYFAGEALSEFDEGFVHGAYFSGEQQAGDMLDCMRGTCKSRY